MMTCERCEESGFSPCADRNGRQRKNWHAKREDNLVSALADLVNEEINSGHH